MRKNKNIKDLFINELNDIYNAEEQVAKALPMMIKTADSNDLKDAFEDHLDETKDQIKRLNQIFEMLDENHQPKSCEAMQGLIKECSETNDKFPRSPLRDAALISKAQRIEHYEISAYGTLRTFAKELELEEVANLLQKTLSEKVNADRILTRIAKGGLIISGVNQKANC